MTKASLLKASAAKSPEHEATIQAMVREAEAWGRGVFQEAGDLYKVSGALDPELPTLMDRFVEELSAIVTTPESVDFEMLAEVNKHSAAPDALLSFHEEVVRPAMQVELEKKSARVKESIFDELFGGLFDSSEQRARMTAASLRNNAAPATGGAFSWSDPMFDVTRGLRKLDEGARSAIPFLALTPAQRAARGVFFESDLPELARNFKPQPRSMREATLLGAQRGVRRANEKMPNPLERLQYAIAERNANRLAYKAQRSRIHGQYPGLLGTLEASAPTLKDKIDDVAARVGLGLSGLPTGAKVGLGLGAGTLGLLGIREIKARQDAKRNRVNVVRQVAAPVRETAADQGAVDEREIR